MTNPYRPTDNSDVGIKNKEEADAALYFLLGQIINGLHRIEKQLEILTDEEIDSDDGSIL
jgi:hypothetical protein